MVCVCVCVFFLSFARALYITETARDEGMEWEGGRCGFASLNDQRGMNE